MNAGGILTTTATSHPDLPIAAGFPEPFLPPPDLGAHTREVLSDAGFTPLELDRLTNERLPK